MSELLAVEKLHRSAQARLGIAVAMLTAERWSAVNPTRPAAAGAEWAATMAEVILAARQLSASLAASYYQLARAVEIGILFGTIGALRSNATLGNARDEFLSNIMAIATLGEDSDASPVHARLDGATAGGRLVALDISPDIQEFLDAAVDSDSSALEIDDFTWPNVRNDGDTLAQIQQVLTAASITPQEEVNKRLGRSDLDNKKALARINESHLAKGQLGAGRADELTLKAGRDLLDYARDRDKRVLKFARGLGPNPCAFCAMLASRGFVYTERSAATTSNGDGGIRKYHPNCHCYPIARWTDQTPLPPLNEFFISKWTEITEDFPSESYGKLNAWRRWLNDMRKNGELPI